MHCERASAQCIAIINILIARKSLWGYCSAVEHEKSDSRGLGERLIPKGLIKISILLAMRYHYITCITT